MLCSCRGKVFAIISLQTAFIYSQRGLFWNLQCIWLPASRQSVSIDRCNCHCTVFSSSRQPLQSRKHLQLPDNANTCSSLPLILYGVSVVAAEEHATKMEFSPHLFDFSLLMLLLCNCQKSDDVTCWMTYGDPLFACLLFFICTELSFIMVIQQPPQHGALVKSCWQIHE